MPRVASTFRPSELPRLGSTKRLMKDDSVDHTRSTGTARHEQYSQ
jgi:hypothetical protein